MDTLLIAPNDPDSMAPLIKQGIEAGIKVGTSDTDAPNSEREAAGWLMATAEGIGKANTDALMKAMGGKGKFAIVSCGETAAHPELPRGDPDVGHRSRVPRRRDRGHRLCR